jgi:hypothetical protein
VLRALLPGRRRAGLHALRAVRLEGTSWSSRARAIPARTASRSWCDPGRPRRRAVERLLADARVKPIGLGARDSLRLEAASAALRPRPRRDISPGRGRLNFAVSKRRREGAISPARRRIRASWPAVSAASASAVRRGGAGARGRRDRRRRRPHRRPRHLGRLLALAEPRHRARLRAAAARRPARNCRLRCAEPGLQARIVRHSPSFPIATSGRPRHDPKFTKDHEYIRVEGTTGTVGITPMRRTSSATSSSSSCPEVGKKLAKGDEAAVVESVKAASEIYAPARATVVEVNTALDRRARG